jgi:hypothetical protein
VREHGHEWSFVYASIKSRALSESCGLDTHEQESIEIAWHRVTHCLLPSGFPLTSPPPPSTCPKLSSPWTSIQRRSSQSWTPSSSATTRAWQSVTAVAQDRGSTEGKHQRAGDRVTRRIALLWGMALISVITFGTFLQMGHIKWPAWDEIATSSASKLHRCNCKPRRWVQEEEEKEWWRLEGGGWRVADGVWRWVEGQQHVALRDEVGRCSTFSNLSLQILQ